MDKAYTAANAENHRGGGPDSRLEKPKIIRSFAKLSPPLLKQNGHSALARHAEEVVRLREHATLCFVLLILFNGDFLFARANKNLEQFLENGGKYHGR